MKRSYLLLAISIILILPVSPLHAENECGASSLNEDIQAQLAGLDEDPIGAFREIIALALGGLRDCSEHEDSFSGLPGAQPVLGPLKVSEGYYIVTMTTEGSAKIESVALEGCGKELDGVIHSFSASQATHGAQNLVEAASDCIFYLELSQITAPWALTIEKVR